MEQLIIKPKEHIAKLARSEELCPGVKLFEFELGDKFDFYPGQFVMLQSKDKEGNQVKRSYSIVSSSGKNKLEMVMNIIPHGKMTPIINRMSIGEKITIAGPFGRFGHNIGQANKEVFLIAAGTGIAPVKCMLDHLLKTKFEKRITLLFGFRHEENYLFKKELESLKRNNANFKLVPSI